MKREKEKSRRKTMSKEYVFLFGRTIQNLDRIVISKGKFAHAHRIISRTADLDVVLYWLCSPAQNRNDCTFDDQ